MSGSQDTVTGGVRPCAPDQEPAAPDGVPVYWPLARRLTRRAPWLAQHVTDAVARAVPADFRDAVDLVCRPALGQVVPVVLTCVRDSKPLPADAREMVVGHGEGIGRHEQALSMFLVALPAALHSFHAACLKEAATSRLPGVEPMMNRTGVVTHQAMQALAEGYLRARSCDESEELVLPEPPEWCRNLSPTAVRVLRLVAEGRTSEDIARRLHCSSQNVNYHVNRLMRRSGAASRTALVSKAYESGLLSPRRLR